MRTLIVGAGTAGSVIASRLSEDSAAEVVLIEAGPDYPDVATMPRDLVDGTRNSYLAHDWGYRHQPTPGQIAFAFPRGKVVGGSSAVNTCIALRGQPYDYDEWGAMGLADWSFEKCLPAFKRLETDLDFDNEWHGRSGPVPIRRHKPDELVPWQRGFLEACRELGYPRCDDHNDPTKTGAGPHAMNKVDGVRMSASRCYLTPNVRARAGLSIRPGTHVRRVLFTNREVTALEVEARGQIEVIATDRVVLSAGAIATPGILLRSGIGPRGTVERIGVTLVAHVPAVGERLLDHAGAIIALAPKDGRASVHHPLIQVMMRYTSERSEYPNDMQVQAGSLLPFPLMAFPLVTLMCCVGKPRGTGTITWTTANPHEKPHIDSALLVDRADRARAVEAMELVGRLAASSAMKPMAHFLWPSGKVLAQRSKITEWITQSCGSGYHPCGTVPMGPEGSDRAAVDGRGRVRGVKGLYVADASIMPTVPSSNTNLPTLMIGERMGEWLRDERD